MTLLRWLGDIIRETGSGRRRLRKLPSDVARSVNILESRVCPSTGTYYGAASADWFGHPELSPADSTESDSAETSVDNDFATGETEALQFLVRLTDEATASAGSPSGAQDFFAGSNADLRITAGLGLPGQVLVATSADPARAAAALEANDAVAHFEENFSVGGALFPDEQTNSTQFVRQYGLHNTGQSGGVSDADIDAPEAWDIATGSIETVVAVIDSGVDYTHPDLYLNIWINQGELPESFEASLNDVDSDGLITFRDLNHALNAVFVTDLNGTGYIDAGDLLDDARWADGIDTDGNGFEDDLVGWDFRDEDNRPFDEHRHGTHVAGIIGATGNNGRGVTGVAWQTSMMPLRFLDENKRGEISDAIEAINYTTMMRTRSAKPVNVRVSNNSWGTSGEFSQHLFDAVAGNLNADILFVAASGNGNVLGRGVDNDKNPFFPASLELDNVISVAAVNDRGELAAFSNFGSDSVDIAAPGVSIRSTIPDGRYVFRSGTSMATPHVAGVAALVLDQFPSATALEVRDAILSGAEIIDSLDGRVSGSRTLNAFKSLNASTFGPVPELFPVANITAAGASDLLVTVRYQDDDSVDATSFDIRDVEITREGFSETLLTPVEAITGPGVMTYRFTAPGGTWDATENGTWVVHLREGEIRDTESLYSAPRVIGKFQVAIDDPNVIFVNTQVDTPDDDRFDGIPADSEERISIRAAVMHANAVAASTTIVIPDGTYTLTIHGSEEDESATGDLDLNSPHGISIIGGGTDSTVINAQRLDRIFDVASGATAEIRGLKLTSGNAENGGGLRTSGSVIIDSSIVSANTAESAGGGIYSDGVLTITNSSIENNQTTSRFFGIGGGGVAILGEPGSSGQAIISNTSIVDNTSSKDGGGVFAVDAALTLTKVTISGNTAERGDGGGLILNAPLSFKSSTLTSVTIANNNAPTGAGGGLSTRTAIAEITVSNSIIGGNRAPISPDIDALILSDGNNLFAQPSETLANWRTLTAHSADLDQIGNAQSPLDVGLDELARTDGAVQTHAPTSDGLASADTVAGKADFAIPNGMPIIYSTAELEPNDSIAKAMNLDTRGWSLEPNPNITDAESTPHVTITGTGDGTFDYFSFNVSQPNARGIFDIDNAAVSPEAFFDSELFLFSADGTLLASIDDASGDNGSTSTLDARIEYSFTSTGRYIIAVGRFDSEPGAKGNLVGSAPEWGHEYVLHVSLENHTLSNTTYDATAESVLHPIAGISTSDGYLFSARRGTNLFDSGGQHPVGELIHSLDAADFNGDGILDIVFPTAILDAVGVQIGNGDGNYANAVKYPVGANPQTVTAGDFDGDGANDIVVSYSSIATITFLFGDGNGNFTRMDHNAGGIVSHLVAGDINRDGVLDIVTASGNLVVTVIGLGGRTFANSASYNVGVGENLLHLDDVSGDGVPDIVAANSDGLLYTLSGVGNGTFLTFSAVQTGHRPDSMDLGDVNGDGFLDVVTGNYFTQDISVLLGVGNGDFERGVPTFITSVLGSVTLNDIDVDGILDLVVTRGSSLDNVIILRGNGDGTFRETERHSAGSLSQAAVASDLNGDGVVDLITPNSGSFSVFLGNNPELFLLRDGGCDSCGHLVSIPQRGTPTQFAVGNDRAYFLSRRVGSTAGLLSSVSLDVSDVRVDTEFAMEPGDHVSLEWTGTDVMVQTNNTMFLHDPVTAATISSSFPDGTFSAATGFGVEPQPHSVATGDFDLDGYDDIVTASENGDVYVLINVGDGSFAAPQEVTSGSLFGNVAVGFFNEDESPDIAVTNAQGNEVSVLMNLGDGSFGPAIGYAVGDYPYAITLGDINGDGDTDLITADRNSNSVTLLAGDGNGTFTEFQTIATNESPRTVAVGHVDDDEFIDVVIGTLQENVTVLFGQPNGEFVVGESIFVGSAGAHAGSVAIDDLNRDGTPDIVVGGTSFRVLLGRGEREFQQQPHYFPGDSVVDLILDDVNADGFTDVITANRAHGQIDSTAVFIGRGDGLFEPAMLYDAGVGISAIATADFNGDGVRDIVVANRVEGEVAVLEGHSEIVSSTVVNQRPFVATATAIFDSTTAAAQLLISDVIASGQRLDRFAYDFLKLESFDGLLLASVLQNDAGISRGQLELLEIDPVTGAAQSLLSESSLRLTTDEHGLLSVFGETVYFTAEIIGAGFGSELFSYDRTNGLRLVADILPGPRSSEVRDLMAHGTHVYFTALTRRTDSLTGEDIELRRLFVLNTSTEEIKTVQTGYDVSGAPALTDSMLYISASLNSGGPKQLWSLDASQPADVASLGATESRTGSLGGVLFLDRNGNGRRDATEPGRSEVTLFVDVNRNRRFEPSEPSVVSRTDDPGTSEDEAGLFMFASLIAGQHEVRQLPMDGFVHTSPLTILTGNPALTPIVERSVVGLPSIIGEQVVYVDMSSGKLVRRNGSDRESILTLTSMLPNEAMNIQSIGISHAQDGNSVVATTRLADERELAVLIDRDGRATILADTGKSVITISPDGLSSNATITDIEDVSHGGFDSLSMAHSSISFLAATSPEERRYYVSEGSQFAEFNHGIVVLDGSNEVFVDRVIEGTSTVLFGNNLFEDKAALDARFGNTGWQITTRNGDVILPLTFFDRIFDVSVSGMSAVFRASSASVRDGIYLSSAGSLTTLLVDTASAIPGGTGNFTGFGSVAGGTDAQSVALDGENLLFIGRGADHQIGLYARVDGTLRTIVDRNSNFGGKTLTDLSIGHHAISSNRIVFRASFSDGTQSIYLATLQAEAVLEVTVTAGDVVSGLEFGARALPGIIRGTSFRDSDADGVFDPGERTNSGRIVYIDENLNGVLDPSEISVTTDSSGEFAFLDLPAEQSYQVREVLPTGVATTTSLEDATVFLPAAGTVELSLGSAPISVRGESVDGIVEGIVFNDVNSNGVQDTSELGEPGVTVFVDENGDAVRNAGEPSVVTAADGAYVIDELDGRRQVVRIELPEGFEQISPSGNSFTTSELRTVDSPIDVVTGNFDGIAGDDIAATISESNEIQFFFNNGVGEFVPGPAIELPDGAGSIAVGQFGDEGHRDGLVIGHHTSSRVTIVRPAAVAALFVTDELVTPQDVQPGGQYEQLGLAPYFVTTGRFNDDQRDDIAVVSQNNASQDFAAVAIFLNNGDGTFPLEQVLSLPKTDARLASAITAGHVIDGSSTVDIVIANTGTQNVTVLSNTGNSGGGRFEIDGHWPIDGNTPTSVQIGDLNGDGVNEIVTTNLFSDNVSILKNNGSDDFPLPTVLPAGKGPAFGRIVDIDQNGSFDIAFTNNDDDNRFGILRNHGDGTFQAAETSGVVRFPDGTLAFSLDIGQFNDDNDDGIIDERDVPDIAVSNRSNDGINGPAGGLTVGLNAIVAGAQRIDLDPDGRIATGLNFGVRSLNLSSTLIVTSAEATSSGFVFHFSEAIDDGVINLSDDSSPSDLSIVGTATGSVAGSLVFSSDATSATFISTGGPLPPDEYQITLRSDATGWVSAAGNLLDGDRDGNTGDDFTTSIIVAAPAAGTITASLPKFVRGAGQPVALTPSAGIPLTLSNGNGVAGVDVTVRYNPALLQITNFVSEVSGVGAVINVATPGIAILTMSSSAAFADVEGTLVLGHFVAFVPDDAPYSSKHVLDLTDLAIFDTAATPGEFPAVDDDGMHVTSYFGDLNGSGTYNAPDVILQQRLIAQINTGLPDFAAIDPVIIGDITGNGRLQAGDTISIQRVITQIDVANVPDLPAGITPLPANGPDPKVFIPRDLTATAGSTVTVPVQLEVTEPNGITIAGLDLVISYDPRMFTVDNIQLSGLLNNTFIMSANTAINGTIILTTSSATGTSLLPFGTIGDLLTIDFTVKSDATAAASAINLLANSGATFTALTDNNLTDLALTPAPTNTAEDTIDGLLTITSTNLMPGNVDGDGDFDTNDSFLIHLAALSGSDSQIDQAKGDSSLTAAQIRSNIRQLESGADVDGDGDYDANDSFLIHLVKLSGSDLQIDQAKGNSSRTTAQIRVDIDNLGGSSASSATDRSSASTSVFAAGQQLMSSELNLPTLSSLNAAYTLSDPFLTGISAAKRRLFPDEDLGHLGSPSLPPDDNRTFDEQVVWKKFRTWIDKI